jgi:hypothetical protein
MDCILADENSKDKTLSSFFLMKPKALETKDWCSVAISVFLSMFGVRGLATSFLSGGMEITIQCVDSVWLFLFSSSVCLEWPVSQPLCWNKKNKLLLDLGGMHTNNRKNQGHKILRGSAKAYIHGAHPHSTHTMKSMNTTVKNYHTTLTISHFSTWHSIHT